MQAVAEAVAVAEAAVGSLVGGSVTSRVGWRMAGGAARAEAGAGAAVGTRAMQAGALKQKRPHTHSHRNALAADKCVKQHSRESHHVKCANASPH